jgi:hypothetical protein
MIPYAKIIGAVALLAFFAWGAYADYSAGKKAGSDAVQRLWDADLLKRQALTDAAIAKATQERDAALTANGVIQDEYQAKLTVANNNAADFAQRLRNATSRLLASSSAMHSSGSGQIAPDPSAPSSAGQLGQLLALITGLRSECIENAAQLTALQKEITPQL